MRVRLRADEPIGRTLRLLRGGVFSAEDFATAVKEWRPIGCYPVKVDELPFGVYSLLIDGRDDAEAVAIYMEAVGKKPKRIEDIPTGIFVDILHGLRSDLERIANAFKSIPQPTLSTEEVAAGFGSLNFGLFGIVDTLATRQGLTDDQVKQMSVATVVGKLNIIGQRAAAERRLQNIFKNKHGRR